jgi:hypothetical protein
MEHRATILSELREISPTVAEIALENPYQVPAGYFDVLAGQVMLRIGAEGSAWVDPVLTVSKENIYSVPQGYFEGLATQVMSKINSEEKTGTDPVLSIQKENIYETPAGYFEGLAGNILNRIKATAAADAKEELEFLSPLLGQIEKTNPFTSPAGYFDEFSDNVVAGVQAIEFVNEELENLSPVMRSLKEKNGYEVPQGYFENLAAEIVNKINRQPAKIVFIGFGRKIIRYAVAAAVVGVMALGVYKLTDTAGSTASTQDPIARLTDDDLQNYLDNNTVSIADTTTVLPGDINEEDGKDLLADVSDEDLQRYLEQHGGTVNPITN